MEQLIKKFGWRITVGACAILILVNAFIGILSKPLNPPKSKIGFGKKKKREVEVVNIEIMSGSIISFKELQTEAKVKDSMLCGLLKEMVNVKLLGQNWRFLLITISNLFVFTGFFLPYIHLTKIAVLNGVPETLAPWIISIVGAFNIPSRIAFGILADKRYLTPMTLNTMSIFLGAIPLFAYEHFLQYEFWKTAAFAIPYAIGTSGLVCLTTPYLFDLVGLEKLPNAMGIISLFRGIGCFVGPVIGGFIAENSTKAMSFYFSGACFVVGLVFSAIVSFSPAKKTDASSEVQAS